MDETRTAVWERVVGDLHYFSDHDFLVRAWIKQEFPNFELSIDESSMVMGEDLGGIIPTMDMYPMTPLQLVKLLEFQNALSAYREPDTFEQILKDPKWHAIEKRAKELLESIQSQDKGEVKSYIKTDEDRLRIFQLFLEHLSGSRMAEDLVFKILKILGCDVAKPGLPEDYQFSCVYESLGYQYYKNDDPFDKIWVIFQNTKPFVVQTYGEKALDSQSRWTSWMDRVTPIPFSLYQYQKPPTDRYDLRKLLTDTLKAFAKSSVESNSITYTFMRNIIRYCYYDKRRPKEEISALEKILMLDQTEVPKLAKKALKIC